MNTFVALLTLTTSLQLADARSPDVVFVPTPHEAVNEMLNLAGVTSRDTVYDLGSGDGRIVVAAAKRGARAVGYDIDPQRVAEGKSEIVKERVENLATIHEGDMFDVDLSGASVVTLYLLPELNVKLLPKLHQLKPGSRIVTYSYDIEGYRPDRVIRASGHLHDIYLFTTPLQPVFEKFAR